MILLDINNLPTIKLSARQKDYTNQKKGQLIYLKPSKIVNNRTYWWMQCDCGEIIEKRSDNDATCCPKCSNRHKSELMQGKNASDLTNQKFTRLTALYIKERKNKQIIWHCKCDCGNECDVVSTALLSGNTKSCGCLKKEKAYFNKYKSNLQNQKFGHLTVLEETPERQYNKIIWKCQCDCGNIVFLNTSQLTQGNNISCGCQHQSFGAQNIEKVLKENHISYKKEYTFNDLPGHRFDFIIFDSQNQITRIIEFDGEQHYRSSGGWNDLITYENRKKKDIIKNEYAQKHNIPLIRIPYWEKDKITLEILIGPTYEIH